MGDYASTGAGVVIGAAFGVLAMPMLGPLALVVGVVIGAVLGNRGSALLVRRRRGPGGR